MQTQIDALNTQLAQRNQELVKIQSQLEASNDKVHEMEVTIAGIKGVVSEQLRALALERDEDEAATSTFDELKEDSDASVVSGAISDDVLRMADDDDLASDNDDVADHALLVRESSLS
jgi:uncharacterized coiled-coil protein SlyX